MPVPYKLVFISTFIFLQGGVAFSSTQTRYQTNIYMNFWVVLKENLKI